MEKDKKFEFYGGHFGPWIPVLFMIISMVLCTITGNGGLQRFCIITFAALAIGFFLAKDKKNFGQLSLKGLRNPMLGTVIMAYLLAGILSQLLRQSGLIDSLILVVSTLNLNVGFLPLVGFITCMLISTSCGTSTGSIAAVAPVLIPLAHSLGVDIGLMSSGAFDALGAELLKLCKSPRSAELVCYIIASIGSAASGGSGIAIVFFGSLVRKITKTFHIDRCRGANILDGVACGATGLMPHGNPVNVVIGVVLTLENFDPNFSFLNILPYNFHCWGLLILFLLSILTGIGRKYEAEEAVKEEAVEA